MLNRIEMGGGGGKGGGLFKNFKRLGRVVYCRPFRGIKLLFAISHLNGNCDSISGYTYGRL